MLFSRCLHMLYS